MNYATVLDTKDNGDIIHSMSDNEIRELIFYFLHVRLKFKNKTEVLRNIHYDDFVNNNLMYLLREYDKSPYKLLNKYYDEFDKCDCRLQTTGKWDTENIKKKVYSLVLKYNLFSDEDFLANFNTRLLEKEHCKNMLIPYDLGRRISLFELIDLVYPGRFKKFQMKHKAVGYWRDKDNVKEALNYVLEKNNISYANAREELRCKYFTELNLKGLLSAYNYSYNNILDFLEGDD